MRADVAQMINKMDTLRKDVDELTENLERILDRGNRPSISFVNNWSELSKRSLNLLPEMTQLAALLVEDIENVSEEDTQELIKKQSLFRDAQARQSEVILRTKKSLGMIP